MPGTLGQGTFGGTEATFGDPVVETGGGEFLGIPVGPPHLSFLETLLAAETQVTRRVDIYEANGTTLWLGDAPLVDGTVTVSQDRAERRSFDLTLANEDGALDHYPEGFWYDKVIKIYRGADAFDGTHYETQIGEFLIDSITEGHFPPVVKINGRDYSKKLILSTFPRSTTFKSGQKVDDVVSAIALNGGLTKLLITPTGKKLGTDFTFERNTTRWDAIDKIADAFNYEVFLSPTGFLVFQPVRDPVTSPVVFTFKTGIPDGSISSFEKSSSDTSIRNHVVVSINRQDLPPIVAEAINNDPQSLTNVERLGDRVEPIESTLIQTLAQAQELAKSRLKITALESFEVRLNTVVIPWLDVGNIVGFLDPNPNPGDPTRFLLSELSIPMQLAEMPSTAKRITIVQATISTTEDEPENQITQLIPVAA